MLVQIKENLIAGLEVSLPKIGKFEVGGSRVGARDRVGAQRPSRSARIIYARAHALFRAASFLSHPPARAPAPPRPARLVAARGDPQRIVQRERNSRNPKTNETFTTAEKYKPRFVMSGVFKKVVAEVMVSAEDSPNSKAKAK